MFLTRIMGKRKKKTWGAEKKGGAVESGERMLGMERKRGATAKVLGVKENLAKGVGEKKKRKEMLQERSETGVRTKGTKFRSVTGQEREGAKKGEGKAEKRKGIEEGNWEKRKT